MGLSTDSEVGRIADQLERSFHGGAWHGPATREILRDVDAELASRRSDDSAHSIADLVAHLRFWMDAARQRIVEGRDVDSDADWKAGDPPNDTAWRDAVDALEKSFARLHHALRELDDDRLDEAVPGSDPTVRGLLLGTLQHNAYHTGQIVQLLRGFRG